MNHLHELYTRFQAIPPKTSPLEDRGYQINQHWKPVRLRHPLVQRWLQSSIPYQTSGIETLDLNARQMWCKICLLELFATIEDQSLYQTLQKERCFFSPSEYIRKLEEFGNRMDHWFTDEESERLIGECIRLHQDLLAVELVYRGVKVSFGFCMKYPSIGSILYSLQCLYPKELERIELPKTSEDAFAFSEVFEEDFCEISVPFSTKPAKPAKPTENVESIKPLECMKEMNVVSKPLQTLSVSIYTHEFYEDKLRKRLEEQKEEQSQYDRWEERSSWWVSHPDEFMIALQQHNMSEYVSELFSPSGSLQDHNYSLVRCSTALDEAVQKLNETYDLEQQFGFSSIDSDESLSIDDELDLLLYNV